VEEVVDVAVFRVVVLVVVFLVAEELVDVFNLVEH
jgi:hypothetical protein